MVSWLIFIDMKLIDTISNVVTEAKEAYELALKRRSKIENSEIEQIGEDQEATELVNGRRYRVINRQYRIQPKISGEFRLSSRARRVRP